MRYRCEACKKETKVSEGTPTNLRCMRCGGAEGQFSEDAVIECIHCGEKKTAKKDKTINIRNNCQIARVTGQHSIGIVRGIQPKIKKRTKSKKPQKRTLTGRFKK
jgi:DNA-directed RNA polymerase subunit RPC12/RpoP